MEAVCVPAQLAPPESLQAKQLYHLHTQLSLGQSYHRKKSHAPVHTRLIQLCPTLCDPIDYGLPGPSVRKGVVLQARMLQCIGQNWLPYPSRALYFLLPLPPTPLSTGCYQNLCNPGSCTTSTPGPHRGKHKSSRAASGANPSGRPTCQGGNKTTIETQGSVAKEEDPKPSHQLYKLQITSTQSTRQTLCLWNI